MNPARSPRPPIDPPAAWEKRSIETVRSAAAQALDAGAATIDVTTARTLYDPDAAYDCRVVVLTPTRPRAATVTLELQSEETWTLGAGGGPHFEFYKGIKQDRRALLASMVRAVVDGRYEHGVEWRRWRELFRPWRHKSVPVHVATFHTEGEPVRTEHMGGSNRGQLANRRFEPYLESRTAQ